MRHHRLICFEDHEGRMLWVPMSAIACIREEAPAVGVLQLVTGIEYRLKQSASDAAKEIEGYEAENFSDDLADFEDAMRRAIAAGSDHG